MCNRDFHFLSEQYSDVGGEYCREVYLPVTYVCGYLPVTYVCGYLPVTYVCGYLPVTYVCGASFSSAIVFLL